MTESLAPSIRWRDLVALSPAQRAAELLQPLPWLALALGLAHARWTFAALVASALFFTAGLRLTHDLYHRNLGLGRRSSDRLLFLLSVLLGGALHAIEHTHLHHHRHCLAEDDLEGQIGKLGFWAALWHSPVYPLLIHIHALRRGSPRQRRWIQVELGAIAASQAMIWSSGSTALQTVSIALLLANAAVPMVGIWSVQRGCEHSHDRARSQRQRWLDGPTFNMLYHLEHHLYPGVPARHLPQLARRLDAARREPVTSIWAGSGDLAATRRRWQRGLALGLIALLPLLGGCRHRLAGVETLDACAFGLPVVAETISYPLALPGRQGDGVAGNCQFRQLEQSGDAAQIQLSLYTDAAAGGRPLGQTLALILAEAGNNFGDSKTATLGSPGPLAYVFDSNGEPAQIVIAERGLVLEIGLRGLQRERALRLAQQLWLALARYRPRE